MNLELIIDHDDEDLLALARQAQPHASPRALRALVKKMKASASIYAAVKASASQQRLKNVTTSLEDLTNRFEQAQERINAAWQPDAPHEYYAPDERFRLALLRGVDTLTRFLGHRFAPRYEAELVERAKERHREATLRDLEQGIRELDKIYTHIDALRDEYETNLRSYRDEVLVHQGWLDAAEQRLAEIPDELAELRAQMDELRVGTDAQAYEHALERARELADERRLYRRALSEHTSAIIVKKGLIEKEQERLVHLEPMLEAIKEFSIHMDGLRQDAALYTDGALSVSPRDLGHYGGLVARVRAVIGAFNESFREGVDAFIESVPLPDGDAFTNSDAYAERQASRLKEARAFAERLAKSDLGYERAFISHSR